MIRDSIVFGALLGALAFGFVFADEIQLVGAMWGAYITASLMVWMRGSPSVEAVADEG